MAVVIATTMFAAFNANAQNSHLDKKFAWGVRAGLNLASVSYDNTDMKIGFNAGLIGEFRINSLLGVSVEPMYSMQGFTEEIFNEDVSYTEHNLNIPIMLKVYPFSGLFIEAGVQPGFCLGAKVKVGDFDAETVDSDGYNFFDLGVGVGAGWDFGNLFVGARYTFGVMPHVDAVKVLGQTVSDAVMNNNFSIHVGYKF